jgi:hypothetical protein
MAAASKFCCRRAFQPALNCVIVDATATATLVLWRVCERNSAARFKTSRSRDAPSNFVHE